MEIKNKQELANTISNYFHSSEVQQQIASFFMNNVEANNRMSTIVGNIITYFVASRNSVLTPQDLQTIMIESTKQYELGNGSVIVNAIKKQLEQTQPTVTANDVLNKLKENFIDNGYYMHACNRVNAKSILEEGLKSHHTVLKDEKDCLLTYIPYEWHDTSYRVFATNNYHTLYKYGICSPEWLYNSIGSDEVIKSQNKQKAFDLIMQKAKLHPSAKGDTILRIENSAKTAINHFFKEKGFAIAIFDRNIKRDGTAHFRNDHAEPINEADFEFQNYLEKLDDNFFVKNFVKKENPNKYDILNGAAMYILNKYSETEASSCYGVQPHELSVAIMPDLHGLTKQTEIEQSK